MRAINEALALWAGLAALALVVSPAAVATQGSLDTVRVEGTAEVNVSAEAPTLMVRDHELPGEVEVTADHLTVERVDDWRETVQGQTTGGEQEVASNNHRNRSMHQHPAVEEARLLGFTEPNATMLVEPLSPNVDFSMQHQGEYRITPRQDRMLEHSHYVTPNSTDSVQYYEYRAEEELGMLLDGESRAVLEGSFEIYLWGITAEVIGDGVSTYETGHHVEDRSQGAQTLTEEHFVFVRMRVSNGTLAMSLDNPAEWGTFADRMDADVGAEAQVTFQDAQGILPGPDRSYETGGDTVAAQDGTYRWAYEGDHVDTTTLDSPAQVEGGQPMATEAEGVSSAWTWVLALLGLVATAGAVWAYRSHADDLRAWLREHRVERWMQTGDRLTSVRDYESAHEYYERITDRYPEISEAWYSQGVVLQEMGRHAKAAEAFEQANESIQEEEPELVDMAACEAWRAGEEDQARELFEQLAVLDPLRLRERLQEPSFSELKNCDWMRELLDVDEETMVHYV